MQGQHTYPWRDAVRMLSVRRFSSSSEVLGKEEGLPLLFRIGDTVAKVFIAFERLR